MPQILCFFDEISVLNLDPPLFSNSFFIQKQETNHFLVKIEKKIRNCEKQKSRSGLFHLEPNAKRPKAPSHRETLHVQIPF